jgi:hypothetical protein
MCGREDCSWSCGKWCEGNSPKPPTGYRVRYGEADFGAGFYFYIEQRVRRWFRWRWEEAIDPWTRASTPAEAIANFKRGPLL